MIQKLVESVEKIFRYLLPGIIFVLLFKISNPTRGLGPLSEGNDFQFSVYIIGLGALVFSLHRLVFEFIDFFLAKIDLSRSYQWTDNYKKTIRSVYPKDKEGGDKELRDYLIYKFAVSHLTLIFAELLFIFSFYYQTDSFVGQNHCMLRWFAIFLFIVSVIHYILLHIIQRKLFEQ